MESSSQSPTGYVQYDRSQQIAVPSSDQDSLLAIRHLDWKRIKNRVSKIAERRTPLSLWYPTLFAIGITSGLSIYPISITKDLPSWVTPLYVLTTIFSFFVGGVFMLLDRKYKGDTASEVLDIKSDMEEVEGTVTKQGQIT